jgi:hypothetical protein
MQVVLRNLRDYARRHGYGVLQWDKSPCESSGRHVLWSKIPALYYALVHLPTSYLWWQDADSLFVLPERSLEFLKPQHGSSLTIAGDHNCYINTGHFMLANTSWTYQFLDDIWVKGRPPLGPHPWQWPEQAMILYIISGWPKKCSRHAEICCQKPDTFDTQNVDLRRNDDVHVYLPDFKRGESFIVHFARNVRGVPHSREKMMRDWDSDPSRTLNAWNDFYVKRRVDALLKAKKKAAVALLNETAKRSHRSAT